LDTATLVGLHDRGMLAPGRRADINLIDYATVGSNKARLVDDLPAGGTRLVCDATGYVATIVAGEITFEAGEHTGALRGALATSTGTRE
jgi:N-acyl-D-aspartate/D-glutamate deacylase